MMFGTIRYDRESQHAEFIDRTESILGDAATEHAACDKCRLTKLRCTGQRSGCDRCKVRGIQCVYSATGSRSARNRKALKVAESTDLKVKKPIGIEKPKEKPKRQGKASGVRRTDSTKPPKAPSKRKPKSSSPNDGYEGTGAEEDAGQRSRKNESCFKAVQPKIEQEMDQDPDRPFQDGVFEVLTTWPQPHQLGMDLEMTAHPYHGLPETTTLDPGFLTTTLADSPNYPELDRNASSPDDGDFTLFTSNSPFTVASDSLDSTPLSTEPSSGITSPMFIKAPGSATDIDMAFSTDSDIARSCNCLGTIAVLFDELDDLVPHSLSFITSSADSSPLRTVDGLLASLKAQISGAATISSCPLCRTRGGNTSLLIRACEMIVRLAERLVLSYKAQSSRVQGVNPFRHCPADLASTPPPTPAPSPSDFLPTVNPAKISSANALIPGSPSYCDRHKDESSDNCTAGMFFGRYKTDPTEYETVMRVLIGLQLKALAALLASILRQELRPCAGDGEAGVRLSEKQTARVQAAQSVVGSLIDRLEGTSRGSILCA
ncbi:hypothetical protein V8F20_011664 [Naviculisporaceae sp. PSN 640]